MSQSILTKSVKNDSEKSCNATLSEFINGGTSQFIDGIEFSFTDFDFIIIESSKSQNVHPVLITDLGENVNYYLSTTLRPKLNAKTMKYDILPEGTFDIWAREFCKNYAEKHSDATMKDITEELYKAIKKQDKKVKVTRKSAHIIDTFNAREKYAQIVNLDFVE